VAAAGAPPPGHALAVAAEYSLSLAPGRAPARQGLALLGMAALRPPVELALGVEVAPPRDAANAAGTLSLHDVPVRAGARLVHRGSRLAAGGGLFAGVHFLSASAATLDGRRDHTFTVAGALGAEALARSAPLGPLAFELRAWVEATLPSTRFLVGGMQAAETGTLALGAALGVTLSTR
jgi:hypothetical protein